MFEGEEDMDAFSIASPAFAHGGKIPQEFTCEGDRFKAPPILISAAPEGVASIAVIMEDPDVPKELIPVGLFVHWIVFDIPASSGATIEVGEGSMVGVLGSNTRGEQGYTGPCPPAQYQPNEHRYFFYAYALDTFLKLEAGATKEEVMSAMEGHVIAKAELLGTYKKVLE